MYKVTVEWRNQPSKSYTFESLDVALAGVSVVVGAGRTVTIEAVED